MNTTVESFEAIKGKLIANFSYYTKEKESELLQLYSRFDLIDTIAKQFENEKATEIYKEVLNDLLCSILFEYQGFYRNAFISLRSALELFMAFIYFLDRNYDYLLWKNNQLDVSWKKMLDPNVGITNERYFSLFISEKIDYTRITSELEDCYRKCSENVHGKYDFMSTITNPFLEKNEKLFIDVYNTYFRLTDLIIAMISIRFNKSINTLDEPDRLEVEKIFKRYEVA